MLIVADQVIHDGHRLTDSQPEFLCDASKFVAPFNVIQHHDELITADPTDPVLGAGNEPAGPR